MGPCAPLFGPISGADDRRKLLHAPIGSASRLQRGLTQRISVLPGKFGNDNDGLVGITASSKPLSMSFAIVINKRS